MVALVSIGSLAWMLLHVQLGRGHLACSARDLNSADLKLPNSSPVLSRSSTSSLPQRGAAHPHGAAHPNGRL